MLREIYLLEDTLKEKSLSAIRYTADDSELKTMRWNAIQHPRQTASARKISEERYLLRTPSRSPLHSNRGPSQEAKEGARAAMIETYYSQQSDPTEFTKKSSTRSMIQGVNIKNANIVQDRAHKERKSGVGIIHTCGRLGDCGNPKCGPKGDPACTKEDEMRLGASAKVFF